MALIYGNGSDPQTKECRVGAQETCREIEDGVIQAIQKRNPDREVGTPVRFYTVRVYKTTAGVTLVELGGVDAKGNSYAQIFAGADDLRDYVRMCQKVLDAVTIEEQKQCAHQKAN